MGPGEVPEGEKCVIVIEVTGPVDREKVSVFNEQLRKLLEKYKVEKYKVEKKYVIRGKEVPKH